MANLSQLKRQRMFEFLQKIRDEHKDDDSVLMALGEIESELNAKKYGLVWEQHEEAVDVKVRTHVPVFTEVKDREISANPGENYNFLLEGDNLHSLYLLEKTHKGKIDIVYIDPPYNTGKKDDFIYNDEYIDQNDLFRHSKWLSFISTRLKIAQKLLANDGVIFISIDDNEYASLKMLCDEILGINNYIATLIWQKKKGGGNDSKYVATEHEYVLVYAKSVSNIANFFIEYDGEYSARYKEEDEKGRFFWDTFKRKSGKQYYPITCPDGTVLEFEDNGDPISWLRSEDRFKTDLAQGEARIIKIKNKWTVHFKQRQPEGYKPRSLVLDYGTTASGSAELKDIFNTSTSFNNPKPVTLIQFFLKFIKKQNSTILDFFAGSGTTAQAVLELNKIDSGNRKFILCTSNENKICENVTYQRIKTVITGKRKDGSQYSNGVPANLKYYRTDFVSKDEEDLPEALLKHIAEMIQLEHGVKLDGKQYIMVLDDDEADKLALHWEEYSDVKALYVSKNVLFTTEQNTVFKDVEIHIIPDYYFNFELREVGESW